MSGDVHFSGEDENAGYATPTQDLIASAFLIILCIVVMIASVRLENPGDTVSTAPGLLPFLTAGSLCIMALALAWTAVQRRRRGQTVELADSGTELHRTLGLFVFIGVYLLALEFIKFEFRANVLGFELGYGAFEVLTIIALTAILGFFWRKSLLSCFAVAACWTTFLAAGFRYIFFIPLPGSI